MSVTTVSGRHARLDVTLDGVAFTRAAHDASRRGSPRSQQLPWDEVTGAELHLTGAGRPVIRVGVVGLEPPEEHGADPHAIKLPRKQTEAARSIVERINDEVATRRRWAELAADDAV